MAKSGRSIILTLLTNFVNSLKFRSVRGQIVGKDHFGNTYYEIKATSNQKGQRWFEPKVQDDFEQEIPAEWESWLRNRRRIVPLEKEVLANAALAKQKKVNAIKLEADRKKDILPELNSPSKGFESFPNYDEYEVYPGKGNKK